MAGLLDDTYGGGLLGNPLFNMGLATLAASGQPGATFGGAVGQGGLLGLQNLRANQQAQAIDQLRKVQLAKAQRDLAADAAWRQMFGVGGAIGAGSAATPAMTTIPTPPETRTALTDAFDPGVAGPARAQEYSRTAAASDGGIAPPPASVPSSTGSPLLAGIPPQMLPFIGQLGPEKGGALLANYIAKNTERGQFVPQDRVINGVKVPGQVDRLSGKWAPLDPSLTKVSVGVTLPPEQDAESKKVGAFYGDAYTNLQNATLTNPGKRAKLQRLDSLLDNVDTGTGAETTLAIKKAAKGIGIDLDALGVKDNVGSAEAGQALANEMALELRNPQGGAGMPGALSDSDRRFLQSMSPGLATTGPGRKLILQSRLKLMDREDQVAKMARDYRKAHGHIDEGFFDQLAQFSEKHPIFAQDAPQPSPSPGKPATVLRFDAQGNPVQ